VHVRGDAETAGSDRERLGFEACSVDVNGDSGGEDYVVVGSRRRTCVPVGVIGPGSQVGALPGDRGRRCRLLGHDGQDQDQTRQEYVTELLCATCVRRNHRREVTVSLRTS